MSQVFNLAHCMREAAQQMDEFRASDLIEAIQCQTQKQRRDVRAYMRDFHRRGEFVRVARGLYTYNVQAKRRTRMEIIWHLVRSCRNFSTDEIERLSGAARDTVRVCLRRLKAQGYLSKTGVSRWRLIKDPGPDVPRDRQGRSGSKKTENKKTSTIQPG